jgi:hypothetical protein
MPNGCIGCFTKRRCANVETYHAPQKMSKQIAFAEKKGIRYVWFPDLSEVKDLETGTQIQADASTWMTKNQ